MINKLCDPVVATVVTDPIANIWSRSAEVDAVMSHLTREVLRAVVCAQHLGKGEAVPAMSPRRLNPHVPRPLVPAKKAGE